MENDNQQRVKSFYRILEEGVAKLPADVRGALYRPCAVDCVKDDVLRELRRQFEECGRDLDRQYTKYGRSEYFFADIIEPGRGFGDELDRILGPKEFKVLGQDLALVIAEHQLTRKPEVCEKVFRYMSFVIFGWNSV